MSKHRNYVFTWNNWNEESVSKLKETLDEQVSSYICWGEEMGENETPHLQGYIELTAPRPITYMCGSTKKPKWLFGARLASRKGNQLQAINYCKKGEQSHEEWDSLGELGPNFGKNAAFTEIGVKNAQGSRNDTNGIKEAALKGGMREVTNIATNPQVIKMAEMFLRYHEPKRNTMPVIFWLWGPTNVGKSHWARQICYQLGYNEDDIFDKDESKWFHDYDGHKCTIFNDFRGGIKYNELLKICDKWPHTVECKGGSRQFNSPVIVFTSDRQPEDCYKGVGNIDQFLRRINNSEVGGRVIHLVERTDSLDINAPPPPPASAPRPPAAWQGPLSPVSVAEWGAAVASAAATPLQALPSVPWTPDENYIEDNTRRMTFQEQVMARVNEYRKNGM